MTPAELSAIAARANLAPSVHNTQPTRWRYADGALWLLADNTRRLTVGDPAGRDLRVSVGAALEATILALGERGTGVGIELDDGGGGDIVPMARLQLRDGGSTDPLVAEMPNRLTWRRGFVPAPVERTQALQGWAIQQDDIVLIHGAEAIGKVSDLNERTSLKFFRNAPYRDELVSWMRLSRTDPSFGVDGLSAPALGMSGFEAFGAGLALRQPLFGLLDAVGLFAGLISEEKRTRSAAAVLLFHRPIDENPVETGRALYRRLLGLSALGFQTWPMAVLADDPDSAAELRDAHGIADDHRLITAWRAGVLPPGATARRERLPVAQLLV